MITKLTRVFNKRDFQVPSHLFLVIPFIMWATTGCQKTTQKSEGATTELLLNLSSQQYAKVGKHFAQELEKHDPGTPEYETSKLAYAISLRHTPPVGNSEVTQVLSLLSELCEGELNTPTRLTAALIMARIYEAEDYYGDPIEYDKARTVYKRIQTEAPESKEAHEAAIRLAGICFKQYKTPFSVETGIKTLESWLKEHPDNVFASAMWEILGNAYKKYLRQPEQALPCFIKAFEIGLTNPGQKGEVYWKIATIAEKSNPSLAREFYQRILDEVPRSSGRGYEAERALERIN
ncbi:MAG: tetratricopeptide repeat protein [Verrucomicrobiota bacterium]